MSNIFDCLIWPELVACGMFGRTRIALNLRRIRAAKGVSQEALAFDAEVDRSYISGIERQTFNPTIDLLDKLAKALGIDVAELLSIPRGAAAKPKPLKPGRRPKA